MPPRASSTTVFTLVCALALASSSSAASGFVTRVGSILQLDGALFRSVGANAYWLGLDENEGGVAYPTKFRISDGLATAAAMGWTVVRGHTLGISTGNPLSFEPSLNVFNDSALDAADWAISDAERLGLKLVIPLTDHWRYYHGGKHDFTDWVGEPDEAKFFTNPAAIAAFYAYISHRLNHTNPYTGRRASDEPSIMCWETGNEFAGAPASWTAAVATYIKSLAPQHLVMDGENGIVPDSLPSPSVDIYSQHWYPANGASVVAVAATVAAAGKVFINGEFGWTGGVNASAYLDVVLADPAISATLYWSLFPHADTNGFVNHADGFTVHYPGDTPEMTAFVATARAHAASFAGLPAPPPLPTPPPPAITAITHARGCADTLAWRGAALAVTYDVQSAPAASGPWSSVCAGCGSDLETPIKLPGGLVAIGMYLRCRGENADGMPGGWSAAVIV